MIGGTRHLGCWRRHPRGTQSIIIILPGTIQLVRIKKIEKMKMQENEKIHILLNGNEM